MKKLLLVFCALLSALCAMASGQGEESLKGKVLDSSGNPLEFATLALRSKDSTIVAASVSDNNGEFVLTASSGRYLVEASLLGYTGRTEEVSIPGTIIFTMDEDREMLAAARVTHTTDLIEIRMDKLVMNVGQSAFAQGSNGYELLKKTPGVTIDKDGNIKLNGKSVAIWIDGRPSYLSGESLVALLRSTSGESLDKFEIMEHPSAKYDAAGQGGIINIKTKKNFANGFNGNIGTDFGGMYFAEADKMNIQASGWGNFAYKGKKTNTFVNLYGGTFDTGVRIDIDTKQELPGGQFLQKSGSYQDFNFKNGQIKAGNDWFIDDRNIFGFIVSLPFNRNTTMSPRTDNSSITTLDEKVIENIETEIDNLWKGFQMSGNLNYTHIFDEKRSAELTANLDWYRSDSRSDNTQKNFHIGGDAGTDLFRNILSNNLLDIYSAKADYQTVLWQKAIFEAGGKWVMTVTDNRTLRKETEAQDRNNDFVYKENIAALYADIAMQFGPKWSAKLGFRGEYTNTSGNWTSAGTTTSRSYFDPFPTLYIGYTPSEKFMANLSYTRRISRPQYMALNPVEEYVDAHTWTHGNPDLLPSYSNQASIQVIFAKHFSISLQDNFTSQVCIQIPEYHENGDQALTWGNFGINNLAVVSANISSLPVAKWMEWSLYTNAMHSYNKGDADFDNRSISFQAYNELTFNLPESWKIEWNIFYRTPMAYGFYVMSPQFSSDLGARKTLMDGRMTLSINVDDLFRTQNNNMLIKSNIPGTESSLSQKYNSQMLRIGLNWNFGKAQQVRQRKVGSLDEISRTGSSSGIGK